MALFTGTIEPISTRPDEKLYSSLQIDIEAFSRALHKKPTYKAYKALLGHRLTLECLKHSLELKVKEAVEARDKASNNYTKTSALAHACHVSAGSSRPVKCPAIAGDMLDTVSEWQKIFQVRKREALDECEQELGLVQGWLERLRKRVEKVEGALVKAYGILKMIDEGHSLDVSDVEHVIHAFALMTGIEDALRG